jgi:5'(3')-deoxyribonucleotidase/uncharacterized membrane protein
MEITNNFDSLKEKRKWISDRLLAYVNIVFAFVVGQTITRNVELLAKPWTYPFAFVALVVVFITVSLSWFGYHKSMYKYPYKAERPFYKLIRPFSDFIIVVFYVLLLFSIDTLKTGPANATLNSFILYFALIFLFYWVDGVIRINEYKDPNASSRRLSFRYFFLYLVLLAIYLLAIRASLDRAIVNWLALVMCPVLYVLYRIQREKVNPKSETIKLVVDVDGVLTDQVTPVLERINRKFGTHYTKADINHWDEPLPLAHTDIKTEIENSHLEPEFILGLKPIPGAQKALADLSKYCEITIATQRAGVANKPTRQWLKNNRIPFDKYVNTGSKQKGLVDGSILIDDYSNNILDFVRQGKAAIVFTQPWNANDPVLSGVEHIQRAGSWDDIYEMVNRLELPG